MLKDLKVKELREVAEEFGVDLSGSKTKAAILEQLQSEGVTDEEYQRFADVEQEEPVVEESKPIKTPSTAGPDILVKMNRANPTYEIRGHKFTSEHPYVVMSESEAQDIFDVDPRGFSMATPKEVEEYYS
jgi:hypothetical protein